MEHKLFQSKKAQAVRHQKCAAIKFLSSMLVISSGKIGCFSSTHHYKAGFFPFIFLFIICSVVFTPSCMQMFFCSTVINRVCQWLLMHLLLPSAQISQKDLLYWENSCFFVPLFAFHIIATRGQPPTDVSLAEQRFIQSLWSKHVEDILSL